MLPTKLQPYSFSYTATNMHYNETIRVVDLIIEHGWTKAVALLKSEDVLGKGNVNTSKREVQEILKRVRTLPDTLLHAIPSLDSYGKKQVILIAICNTYGFIKDFIIEVLRNKFLTFDYQINETDYNGFFRHKLESHPEMAKLSDSTVKKLKQVTFRMLEQAGLINSSKSRIIQPQILDANLKKIIHSINPEWLMYFFYSDKDIELQK